MFWTTARSQSLPDAFPSAPASVIISALEPPRPDWGGTPERMRMESPSPAPKNSTSRVASSSRSWFISPTGQESVSSLSSDTISSRPSERGSTVTSARRLIAVLTVSAGRPSRWHSGQMSRVPPDRSMRAGAEAEMTDIPRQ